MSRRFICHSFWPLPVSLSNTLFSLSSIAGEFFFLNLYRGFFFLTGMEKIKKGGQDFLILIQNFLSTIQVSIFLRVNSIKVCSCVLAVLALSLCASLRGLTYTGVVAHCVYVCSCKFLVTEGRIASPFHVMIAVTKHTVWRAIVLPWTQ